MSSLLKHVQCASCGHRHHFCLAEGDLAAAREYDYVCPETGHHATLRPDGEAEAVHYWPQGAVQLTPSKSPHTVG
jgi:hypothetical protein